MKNLLNPDCRASGLLLHITSLPSPWGVGDLGPMARRFIDQLAAGGQRVWQVLPLNPTDADAGDSPYFSYSSQAGNPLLISIEDLQRSGWVAAHRQPEGDASVPGRTDYVRARELKIPLLISAADRVIAARPSAFREFCAANRDWLDDHALFVALHAASHSSWAEWSKPLIHRDADAMRDARAVHAHAIERECAIQFLFHEQWLGLRRYAAERQVHLFGDMPIYVNADSVDVWRVPEVFQLDEQLRPRLHSGVPPDYFSADGQLWRNPVYDWDHLAAQDFSWWVARLKNQLARFDILRIDHFRGLVKYWAVAADASNAINGEWLDVPADALMTALTEALGDLPLVAEDLGTITPDVIEFRERWKLPGMAVMQFAFGDDYSDNPHKLHNHRANCIAYLGTHDNTTTLDWLANELDHDGWQRLKTVADVSVDQRGVRLLIDALLGSRAMLTILSVQDLLTLPGSARMNTPGTCTHNWTWQLTEEQLDQLPMAWLSSRCSKYGRA